ncbi:unnamed protein product (macronuclear) [Paramecium tetraurelia]|uniref:Uncharacterized protein n=1 Tax=Paramecium tetraurelia TaxID=5888 RepID=A0DRD9_PARTE|nr:uncharacterized protein GSPATT00019323001 [Paramecium tetraurelia]CAK85606.1 unnamed protein product [Paramecium tetraurelia]|eukprot:XP_001453003.1 hypothetical protein (macronuclear) [Paramecium tetraurelia strain d4-2]
MQDAQFLNYQVEAEPNIQPIRSIKIQQKKGLMMIFSSDSENLENDLRVDNSQYYRKQCQESYSLFTTKNSLSGKLKTLTQPSNSITSKAKLASIRKIKSFRLDEDAQSQDEEESLPKDFMKVNFQFKQDLIINVQKILQQKK